MRQLAPGGQLELHGGLHAGFDAACYENPFEAAVAKPSRIGFERVFARIERGKAEGAILRCGGLKLSASGLVAQDDGDASQRTRMQIGKASGKGT